MNHVTCRLTAKNRDQLRNPTLGNRVWATSTFLRGCDQQTDRQTDRQTKRTTSVAIGRIYALLACDAA